MAGWNTRAYFHVDDYGSSDELNMGVVELSAVVSVVNHCKVRGNVRIGQVGNHEISRMEDENDGQIPLDLCVYFVWDRLDWGPCRSVFSAIVSHSKQFFFTSREWERE